MGSVMFLLYFAIFLIPYIYICGIQSYVSSFLYIKKGGEYND